MQRVAEKMALKIEGLAIKYREGSKFQAEDYMWKRV
jgi:hypothetical protein